MTAAAAIPLVVSSAKGAQHTISEALTADLAVIRWEGRTPRKRKGIARKPVEYELHVNPAAIGLGALGVAATLFILDENVRRGSAGAWWELQKTGSPLGYMVTTYQSPVGHAVAAWNALIDALTGR